jgi:hypothetical protein
VGAEFFHADRQANEETDTQTNRWRQASKHGDIKKLIAASQNFANVTKK